MAEIKELIKIASSLSLLYVEDEENIAKTAINYFSKIFNKVTYAENGKKGLETYKQDNFDIVITDINMPEMNGLELARKIKEVNEKQNIIFITAYSEDRILLESIKIGIEGYLIKPIDFKKVNELLYKICMNIRNSNEKDINIEQQRCLMNHISQKNTLLKQYTDVIDKVAIVSKTDLKGNITYVNDFFCEISGYKNYELLGKSHNIVRHPDMSPSIYSDMWETIKEGNVWEGTIKNKTKDDNSYFVHATIIPIIENDTIDSYIGIRFLSTEEEIEKREFRKKVRINIQEFKKSNLNLLKEVQNLKNELSLKNKSENISQIKIKDLEKRLQKANYEIKHYEQEFFSKKEKKYDVLENYKTNLNDITTKYKDAIKQLDIKKNELSTIKKDNDAKKKQLLKVNEEIIKQKEIILDLRDTMKNVDEEKEDVKTKNKSFLERFK